MKKYAYILGVPGVDPKTYAAVCKTETCYGAAVGVPSIEAGKRYVRKLAKAGFTDIDLCGSFGDEVTKDLRRCVSKYVKIRNIAFSFDELIKFSLLDTYRSCGVIIKLDGLEKIREVVLRSRHCDTRVAFVRDLHQARNVGRRFLEKRIEYIELSRWFDRLRMDEVVEATRDLIPMGTCGDLSMRELVD